MKLNRLVKGVRILLTRNLIQMLPRKAGTASITVEVFENERDVFPTATLHFSVTVAETDVHHYRIGAYDKDADRYLPIDQTRIDTDSLTSTALKVMSDGGGSWALRRLDIVIYHNSDPSVMKLGYKNTSGSYVVSSKKEIGFGKIGRDNNVPVDLIPQKTGETTLSVDVYEYDSERKPTVTVDLTIEVTQNTISRIPKTRIYPKITVKNVTYDKKTYTPSPTVLYEGKTLKRGTDYSLKTNSRKNVGKVRYEIHSTTNTIYLFEKVGYLKIDPKGASLKKLKGAKRAVTVNWSKQTAKMSKNRITGYKIQLATNSKFTKNKKTVTVKGYSKSSRKITKLKKKKKYYVRIRTYMKVGGEMYYSGWSKTKTVITK